MIPPKGLSDIILFLGGIIGDGYKFFFVYKRIYMLGRFCLMPIYSPYKWSLTSKESDRTIHEYRKRLHTKLDV